MHATIATATIHYAQDKGPSEPGAHSKAPSSQVGEDTGQGKRTETTATSFQNVQARQC